MKNVTIGIRELRRDADKHRLPGPRHKRPQTRAECPTGPCPFVGCRHHLYLDANSNGSITFNQPDKEPHELETWCSLDEAKRGGMTLEQIGEVFTVTRERIRQIERRAFRRLGIWAPRELL